MRVLERATPTVTRVIHLKLSSEERDKPIAYGSAAVTTCFYDLCLSRLGLEHPTSRLRGERSNRLRHHGGTYITQSVYVCTLLSYGNIPVLSEIFVFVLLMANIKLHFLI